MKILTSKPIITSIVLIAIVGAIIWLEGRSADPASGTQQEVAVSTTGDCQRPAQQIVDPSGYVNTGGKPITIEEYIGQQVILIDFLTYSCINCQRTFPYLNAWHGKYADHGLQIIGIHTPEFEFEKDIENVRQAAAKFGIDHPLVLDNNYGTWRAYGNRYWPRKYLIDINGCIVYDHIGEGSYQETEQIIQQLLADRNTKLNNNTPIPDGFVSPEAEQRASGVRTPEIYLGAKRNGEYLANGPVNTVGTRDYTAPSELTADKLYLDGRWSIRGEYAENGEAGASIQLLYQAKEVYMVLAAPQGATIAVRQDGDLVQKLQIGEEALYTLIENTAASEHKLEITVEEGTLQAFTFTFG